MKVYALIFVISLVSLALYILFIRVYAIYTQVSKKKPTAVQSIAHSLCHDENAVLYIQKLQWMKAREEILGSSQAGYQGDDMDFYKRSYGAVDLSFNVTKSLKSKDYNRKNLTSLVYYRIYKNANDNIRSLLLHYAFMLDDSKDEFIRQNCLLDNQCRHARIHYFVPHAIKNIYFSTKHKRYAFTFIREPLQRFVSAMTEVEYRTQLAGTSQKAPLPFRHPLGSQLRVEEFIRMLVQSGGTRGLFLDTNAAEVIHIAPMIGTILLANKVEASFRVFRLEDFDRDWKKMTNETGLPLLSALYEERKEKNQWNAHSSSQDPLGTALAARSFLSFASEDAFLR